jgi:hypothetical protein
VGDVEAMMVLVVWMGMSFPEPKKNNSVQFFRHSAQKNINVVCMDEKKIEKKSCA